MDGVPYVYDANGNLLNDGQNTYTYDSANRLSSVSSDQGIVSSYGYNGLGDRLLQNGVNYTLDLNAGLTQVLDDGTNTYTYGLGRISQQSASTPEYFLGDALGSVRQLVNNAGEVTLTNSYDPYGEVLSSAGSGSSAFAYTGAQQDASGLTYLRARYYNPVDGRFISRDTWGGDANRPLSFNRWMYVGGNPINLTDPSGNFPPLWCQSMPNKAMYEGCLDLYYGIEPISYFKMGEYVTGEKGCYQGPFEYRASGYLEGFGDWMLFGRGGHEVVYDFATMERQNFIYLGLGINDALDTGGGVGIYVGGVKGFRTDSGITSQYRDWSGSVQIGASGDLGIGVGGGGGIFWSWSDFMLRGAVIFVGGSLSGDFVEGVDIDFAPILHYWPDEVTRVPYAANGQVRKADLVNDILTGTNSPAQLLGGLIAPYPARVIAAIAALRYANAYEDLRNENVSQ